MAIVGILASFLIVEEKLFFSPVGYDVSCEIFIYDLHYEITFI